VNGSFVSYYAPIRHRKHVQEDSRDPESAGKDRASDRLPLSHVPDKKAQDADTIETVRAIYAQQLAKRGYPAFLTSQLHSSSKGRFALWFGIEGVMLRIDR
jgi:hypothetical protein